MTKPNEAQIEYWNGRAGDKWSAMQVVLDQMLAPVTAELKHRAGAVSGLRVLDIGCGTGETCVLWQHGRAIVTGVDVSAPMLALAARRTEGKVTLVEADASAWLGEKPFDLAVSRFGVMFFDDPVRAFKTIAANLRPGGRLLFSCWQPVADNPWVSVPMSVIRELLPDLAPPVPHAPGPFGLADKERLRGILERAGFKNISIEPFIFPVCLARSGGLDAGVRFITQVGPAGAALAEASDEVKAEAEKRLRSELAPYVKDDALYLGGAAWLTGANSDE